MAKSKPIGVRFDLEILERIKKEQGLKTPQAVLNYLMDKYGPKPKAPEKPPPPTLKGIDLAIWKAEQNK